MVFQRSVIITVCVSLGAGFFSFFLFRPSAGGASFGEYGVLSVDQSCSDRTIGRALTSAGIEPFFSESSQWVYLDDFGELVKVPLDEYSERLEPFDPRNDGYAERLRSFFVRDGTRRFFIPLNLEKGDSRKKLAGRLGATLGDTPYTLEFLVRNQPFSRTLILFAVFAAAVLASLFLSEAPFPLVFLIPLCVPLVFLGSPGMALTGTLFAFSGSLTPPAREFFTCRRRLSHKPPDRLGVPVFSCLMPLVFAFVYVMILRAGNILFLSALSVLLSCCCVTGTVLWAGTDRDGHIRFHPAPIKKTAVGIPGFFRYFKLNCPRTILPWIPAAIFPLVLSFLQTGADAKPNMELLTKDIPILCAEDYEAHLAFQRSFSLRPLEDAERFKTHPESLPYSDYYRYSIGDDGLVMKAGQEDGEGIAQTGFGAPVYGDYGEFPPFPLADFMGFLEGYTPAVSLVRTSGNLIVILLILIPALSSLIRGGRRERKGGSSLVFNDKRIAA
jgi:hypothetical protein